MQNVWLFFLSINLQKRTVTVPSMICFYYSQDTSKRVTHLFDDSSVIILDNSYDELCKIDLPLTDQIIDKDACINNSVINETIQFEFETKQKESTGSPKCRNANITITLDDSDTDGRDIQTKQETADLDSILNRLNKITITSMRKNNFNKKTDIPDDKPIKALFVDRSDSPLPFSMRMKKLYDNASIFSKDN
jgi:hypothetical protein